jgi:Restriction endonuclease
VSAADELHERIFGFVPAKAGTAYERLAAIVLAGLGWESVKHQTKLQPQGRRAEQRLDVTATHPDGSIQRLLVECKDWGRDVGKGTMDALIGVRDQTGFDSAMAVTTKGFTSGAIDVAVDEDIAMVRLREVRSDDSFVMAFSIEIVPWGHDWSNVQLLVASETEISNGRSGHMSTEDRFLHTDGSPAETLNEIFESQSVAWKEGAFDHEVRFEEGRLAPTTTGGPIPVIGVKWTETAYKSSPHKSTTKAEGEPCLVVEQIDENGVPERPRLVVDQHLNAWDIADDGTVVERGKLT